VLQDFGEPRVLGGDSVGAGANDNPLWLNQDWLGWYFLPLYEITQPCRSLANLEI
jgi:hypothetical protein